MIAYCNFTMSKTRIFTRLHIYSRLHGNMFKENVYLLDEMYLKITIESINIFSDYFRICF